jgi:hypothetical protein
MTFMQRTAQAKTLLKTCIAIIHDAPDAPDDTTCEAVNARLNEARGLFTAGIGITNQQEEEAWLEVRALFEEIASLITYDETERERRAL